MPYKPIQIAKILGMSSDRDLLMVQGLEDKKEYQRGGSMHGYRYEWGINHFSFQEKESTKDAFNLTDAEWDYWDSQYVKRFSHERDEWYTDESIRTFNKIAE